MLIGVGGECRHVVCGGGTSQRGGGRRQIYSGAFMKHDFPRRMLRSHFEIVSVDERK